MTRGRSATMYRGSIWPMWIYGGFGTAEERPVDRLDVAQAKKYLQEGQFLEGSMAPKVRACIQFIEYGGEEAIITSLDRAWVAIQGQEGTHIVP